MILIILLCLLAVLTLISVYGIYNLTVTNEKLLEANEELDTVNNLLIEKIDNIRLRSMEIESQLTELDLKGSFEADDEVGFFFKEIRTLHQDLQKTIREQYGEPIEA